VQRRPSGVDRGVVGPRDRLPRKPLSTSWRAAASSSRLAASEVTTDSRLAVCRWCGPSFDRQRSALDPGNESAGERLGVSERDHVAGARDQRVLGVGHVPPDDVADRVVDGGCLRSLDDVDRRDHADERVKGEQVVEENVP
jgi:hypothetical protein